MSNQLILRVNLANTATYTLKGNDRAAEIGVSSDQTKTLVNVSPDGNAYGFLPGDITIPAGKALHIVGIAAYVDGGRHDASAGVGKVAFNGSIVVNDGSDVMAHPITVAQYDHLYPLDILVNGYPGDPQASGAWGLTYGAESTFTLDDYALLDEFVGQSVTPYIELTAEVL